MSSYIGWVQPKVGNKRGVMYNELRTRALLLPYLRYLGSHCNATNRVPVELFCHVTAINSGPDAIN